MKHCLYSAAKFAGDLFNCCPDGTQLQNDLLWVLFPLILDGCTENLSDPISGTLERAIGRPDGDEFLAKVRLIFNKLYDPNCMDTQYSSIQCDTIGLLVGDKLSFEVADLAFTWAILKNITLCCKTTVATFLGRVEIGFISFQHLVTLVTMYVFWIRKPVILFNGKIVQVNFCYFLFRCGHVEPPFLNRIIRDRRGEVQTKLSIEVHLKARVLFKSHVGKCLFWCVNWCVFILAGSPSSPDQCVPNPFAEQVHSEEVTRGQGQDRNRQVSWRHVGQTGWTEYPGQGMPNV